VNPQPIPITAFHPAGDFTHTPLDPSITPQTSVQAGSRTARNEAPRQVDQLKHIEMVEHPLAFIPIADASEVKTEQRITPSPFSLLPNSLMRQVDTLDRDWSPDRDSRNPIAELEASSSQTSSKAIVVQLLARKRAE
jgi:hypothetical protein